MSLVKAGGGGESGTPPACPTEAAIAACSGRGRAGFRGLPFTPPGGACGVEVAGSVGECAGGVPPSIMIRMRSPEHSARSRSETRSDHCKMPRPDFQIVTVKVPPPPHHNMELPALSCSVVCLSCHDFGVRIRKGKENYPIPNCCKNVCALPNTNSSLVHLAQDLSRNTIFGCQNMFAIRGEDQAVRICSEKSKFLRSP